MVKIAPSILSADFGKLNEDIATIEKHADLIHVDVMDGHFVPNITIGPCVVKGIRTSLPLDVHLMISEPLRYAPDYAKYAKMISFHGELFEKDPAGLHRAIEKIKRLKVKAGLALNPDKSLDIIRPVLKDLDFVLIMSVYAGFGGQKFIPDVLAKVRELKKMFGGEIEIDGGINAETARLAREAGCDILVAGNYIFGSGDRKKAILSLRQ
jgi:ribulose-phosphate 3-epimerase